MIEFNQLEHLVSVAKNKTISKAAEELLISQPGLTRSMQRLEDDLGLSLFNRKKNKIELNENGRLAVEFAQKLLDGREEMIKELTKLSQNHISFGSCAPAPLWGVEYALSNNTEAQIESTLVQDEKTLIEGLEKGKIAGAALDVIENESGLYYNDLKGKILENRNLAILKSFPNVIVTPHTAFYTDQAVSDMVENSIKSILLFDQNKDNPWQVL